LHDCHLIHYSVEHTSENLCESAANVSTPHEVNTGIVADLDFFDGILAFDLW
jgi:hypothetical protein